MRLLKAALPLLFALAACDHSENAFAVTPLEGEGDAPQTAWTVLQSVEQFEESYRATIEAQPRDQAHEGEVRRTFERVLETGWNDQLFDATVDEVRCGESACYILVNHNSGVSYMTFKSTPLTAAGLPVYDAFVRNDRERLRTFIATTRNGGTLPRLKLEPPAVP